MAARTAKIVFLGATSMSFGLSMLRDAFSGDELRGSTLTLVGRNPETLNKVAELARLLNRESGAGLVIEQTTDRRAALDGADFVVNATAIDRNRLWKADFEVPRKYGIRHTLGENGGPGGLFFTLRTLPLVFDIAREMHELCPRALFVNFSNPESRIILALGKYSPIAAVGLCHGIFMGRDDVARIMGLDSGKVEIFGRDPKRAQHQGWIEDFRPVDVARHGRSAVKAVADDCRAGAAGIAEHRQQRPGTVADLVGTQVQPHFQPPSMAKTKGEPDTGLPFGFRLAVGCLAGELVSGRFSSLPG